MFGVWAALGLTATFFTIAFGTIGLAVSALSPWPWVLVGLALVVIGVVGHRLRQAPVSR